ncbi:MAG: hypothetical protein WKF66_20715 [Pedobacter sp.]
MIKQFFRLSIVLALLLSCKKDASKPKITLFSNDYKNLQLSSGFKNNSISINGADWSVEYVKDAASGKAFLDQAGQTVALKTSGSVELQNGWLKLERKQADDQLILSLKENLSANPRKFLIGILADGNRDELSIAQTRGQGYAIVKKEITEVTGSRNEYTTDEGLYPITVTNNDFIAKYLDISEIFKDVKHMSELSSEDDDAFSWVNTKDTSIFMQEIKKDGTIYWSQNVPYKKGQSFEPYVKMGSKIQGLVQANTTVRIRGKVTYLSRESHYTFTIKNLSSGNTFEVSGIWKQKVPISTTSEIY